jgi:hypothetical protein
MSRSPPVVALTNGVPSDGVVSDIHKPIESCQAGEVLPSGTTAVRLSLYSMFGPRLRLRVLRGREVITSGEEAAGWSTPVTVPVKPLRYTATGVSVCFAIAPKDELVGLEGVLTGSSESGVSITIEYLRPGGHSWWALASSVASRMALGRATSGVWIVLAVLVAMVALVAVVSVTALSGRRVAACVAFAAALNAACWAVVTPPFEVSDEPAHFAYVKQLAETGRPPQGVVGAASEEMTVALNALHFTPNGNPGRRMITSQSEQDLLQRDLDVAARLPRDGSENAGVATAEPPLYYAVEAIPYLIAFHGTVLDRLQLMRLISALLAGLTGFFAFLFVREALPGEPWAWSTAGLGVAVTPLLGFMSGAVNPDAMLFAVSAALFFCFARAFRRGLTRWLAGAVGAVIAIGVLTKLNFVGLLPGALVGLAILSWRARASLREACLRIALACATAITPVLAALAVGALRSHGGPHRVTSGLTQFLGDGSLKAQFDYVWQMYLPRLPGMAKDFPDLFTSRQIWFDGFVGAYGWGETVFASWVYDVALVPAAAIAGLTIRAVYRRRAALRARAAEIGVYTLMSLGVLVMIAAASYPYFPVQNADFARVRYLLPMLALLGALLALAARGAGRRWGPAVGVLIVVLMLDHDIFSQLLVVSHYYG